MNIGIVQTKYGKVSGIECGGEYEGVTIFKGIPYAAPPVGDLRWRPPVDPAAWDGVRVCDTSGNIPVQKLPTVARYLEEFTCNGIPPMSEDCLYMDICTPAETAGEKLPVYMWFHGGGLTNCYAYEAAFDPREFAKQGIICITVEQRLNIFGYMVLPQLSAEQDGKSGNYGLMDQIKALDWVYENIEAFGGDPQNITVGGQSGGSQKTMAMIATPKSKGRIRRSINESGLKWLQKYPAIKEAEEQGRDYLAYAGFDPDMSLDELRKIDARELLKDVAGSLVRKSLPASLVFDGEWVPCKDFIDAFDKYLSGVDIINGTNMGEASVFATSAAKLNPDTPVGVVNKITNAADFYAHYKALLGPLYDRYDFEKMVEVDDETAHAMSMRLASLGLAGGEASNMSRSVMLQRVFGRYMARRYPESKIYSYLFSHMMPIIPEHKGTSFDPEQVGAWHSSELWYAFNSLREGVPPHRPWRDLDYKMGKMFNTYLSNFIKTGDPSGVGLPEWPRGGKNFEFIELQEKPVAYEGLDSDLDKLIYEFLTHEYGAVLKQVDAI